MIFLHFTVCADPDPGIPAWLIVVPIIVGLLLLAIAFVILVKLIIIYLVSFTLYFDISMIKLCLYQGIVYL